VLGWYIDLSHLGDMVEDFILVPDVPDEDGIFSGPSGKHIGVIRNKLDTFDASSITSDNIRNQLLNTSEYVSFWFSSTPLE
jgi:hypothetical protein